jgi:hypothetical protein
METRNNDNNNNIEGDDNNSNNHNNHFHNASYTGLLVIAIKRTAKQHIFKVATLGAFAKLRRAIISFVMAASVV